MKTEEVIERFLQYHASDSPSTLKTFKSILKSYAVFLDEKGYSEFVLTREIVVSYLEEKRAKLKQKSLFLHYQVLTLLGKFCWRKLKLISADDYEDLKDLSRKYKPNVINRRKALSRKDLHRLEEYLKNKVKDPTQFLVFALGTYAGLRVEEMVNLRVDHIFLNTDDRPNYILVKGKGAGKGKKEREVVILPELKGVLVSYLHYRASFPGSEKNDFLLLSERGKKLSVRTIQHWVRTWGLSLNIEGLTPHVLRHTFAAELRRRGVNEYDIQQLLGHASISTTANYGHVPAKEIHERVKSRWY